MSASIEIPVGDVSIHKPSLNEVASCAARASLLAGCITPFVLFIWLGLQSGRASDIGMALIAATFGMFFGIILALFTAFPLGTLLGWMVSRVVELTPLRAAATGMACAAILLLLTLGDAPLGPEVLIPATLFCAIAGFSGWQGYRFTFGSSRSGQDSSLAPAAPGAIG